MKVTYRRLASGDWDKVREFLTREGEPVEHASAVLDGGASVAWLALDGAQIAGWILTQPMPTSDGAGRGGVEDVVVAQTHRGQGIGRRLIELAEAYYREDGCAGMQLTVREDNETARHLYESLGYAVVQRRLRMWKNFG